MNKLAVLPLLKDLSSKVRGLLVVRGGAGSGNFGHSGCPGSVGGSCKPGAGGGATPAKPAASPAAGRTNAHKAETFKPAKHNGKVWEIDGQPAPDFIQKLGIPPGVRDVRVNLDPNANRHATWVDAKGRGQVMYSDNHHMQAAAAKFGRVAELRKARKEIYKEVENDLKNPKLKERAAVTRLVMQTGMRPGSDADTKAKHKSYGATTLEGRHVIDNGDGTVTIKFVPGKKGGKEIEMPVTDKKTAKDLLARAKKAGADGRIFDTNAGAVRNYSKGKGKGGFKTKDHRTALGTETAIAALKGMRRAKTEKEYKAAVKEVSTKVSQVLGNTAKIAFNSYIDPVVWEKVRPK